MEMKSGEEMKITGHIEAEAYYNGDGERERIEYRWEGGNVIGISRDLIDERDHLFEITLKRPVYPGQHFRIGPYRLRVIEDQSWRAYVMAIREDGMVTNLLVAWHRCKGVLNLIYRRLIRTAAIWGLVEFPAQDIDKN
jgi:hypothetical protein